MSNSSILHGRRSRPRNARRLTGLSTSPTGASSGLRLAYPGYHGPQEDSQRRTWITAAFSAALHAAALGLLVYLASLADIVPDRILPVHLLHEEAPEAAPAPAPKRLAERRSRTYAPSVQSLTPEVLNPRVIAEAVPVATAESIQVARASRVQAPTRIERQSAVVERVAVVDSGAGIRAQKVDLASVVDSGVRGPTRIEAPAGPSVGPRRVEVDAVTPTLGSTPVRIAGQAASSSPEGLLSERDVLGAPQGVQVVSVNTVIGQGHLPGAGGTGSSLEPAGRQLSVCFQRPEVSSYLMRVKDRTIEHWLLPPGVQANQSVTLRFQIDSAGSAMRVSFINASDNALGASAADALRAAAPFPPMLDEVRCLAQVPILATFTNPTGG
ncbi:MAG: TonB C-terminal domain-containing protein [Myxococcota bacterium]